MSARDKYRNMVKNDYERYEYFLSNPRSCWLSLVFPGLHHLLRRNALFKRETRIKGLIFFLPNFIFILVISYFEMGLHYGTVSLPSLMIKYYYYIGACTAIFPGFNYMFTMAIFTSLIISFVLSILSMWESFCSIQEENRYRIRAISLLSSQNEEFLKRITDIHFKPDEVKNGPVYTNSQGRMVYRQTTIKTSLSPFAKEMAKQMQKVVDEKALELARLADEGKDFGQIHKSGADDGLVDLVDNTEMARKIANKAKYNPEELLHLIDTSDSKPVVIEAVKLVKDDDTLFNIVSNTPDRDVALAAVKNMKNQEMLVAIAENSQYHQVVIEAVRLIEDEETLFNITSNAQDEDIALVAVKNIKNQEMLTVIAENTQYGEVAVEAASRLSDEGILIRLAEETKDLKLKAKAVSHISERSALVKFFIWGENKEIKTQAFNNLKRTGYVSNVIIKGENEELAEDFMTYLDCKELRRLIETDTHFRMRFSLQEEYRKRLFEYYKEEDGPTNIVNPRIFKIMLDLKKCKTCGAEYKQTGVEDHYRYTYPMVRLECPKCGYNFAVPECFVTGVVDPIMLDIIKEYY